MGRSISLASSRQMGASQAATVASTKPTVAILVLVVMASGTLHLRQQDKPLNQLQMGELAVLQALPIYQLALCWLLEASAEKRKCFISQ